MGQVPDSLKVVPSWATVVAMSEVELGYCTNYDTEGKPDVNLSGHTNELEYRMWVATILSALVTKVAAYFAADLALSTRIYFYLGSSGSGAGLVTWDLETLGYDLNAIKPSDVLEGFYPSSSVGLQVFRNGMIQVDNISGDYKYTSGTHTINFNSDIDADDVITLIISTAV